MKNKLCLALPTLVAIISLSFVATSQAAPGGGDSSEISQVILDESGNLLTIRGTGLSVDGVEPIVTLEGFVLTVTEKSANQIIASFAGPESPKGDYLLTVDANVKRSNPAKMMLTLGTRGPIGPQGPAGPPGVTPEQLAVLESRILALEELLNPDCRDLPSLLCEGTEEYCGQLLPFEPVEGPGYDNYPINGETTVDQYRSYVRRDLMMLIKHATARVACETSDWTFGNGGPLGLGDMSEFDGAIPGTSIGTPAHPAGTHENGLDIDVAYFQTDTDDNRLRVICTEADHHCSGPPHLLDADRTALFLGYLTEHPRLRIIGVDGQAGLVLDDAAFELCADGLLDAAACVKLDEVLTYEVEDGGLGWFRFFHHHIHISLSPVTP